MNSKKTVQAVFCLLVTACLLMTACPSGGGGGSVALKGITVTPKQITRQVGSPSFKVVPTFTPANASNKKVTYSLLEDNGTISVDSLTGVVTVLTASDVFEGDVVIVTSDSNKSITAECVVKVIPTIAVTGLKLNTETLNLIVGDVENLIYTTVPFEAANKSVTWNSNNPLVATVSPTTGVVKATGIGTAFITVTSLDITNGVVSKTCTVNVKAANSDVRVTGITLDRSIYKLTMEGEISITLEATITPEDAADKTVTWLSSNAAKATVDASGTVTAVEPGSAIIIVTTRDGGKVAFCAINVDPAQPETDVTGVELDKSELTITAGKTATLTATVHPEDATNKFIIWESGNPNVAMVEYSGEFGATVTGIAEGTAIITVTTEEGEYTAACIVKVEAAPLPPSNVPVTGVTIDVDVNEERGKKLIEIAPGEKITLPYTVLPATATNKTVFWSSGDTSKVTVSPSGELTGVATTLYETGDVKITVMTDDGNKMDTCDVWVRVVSVVGFTITAPANIDHYLTFQFEPEFDPPSATYKNLTWSSSAPARGTIDENGLFTAVSPGAAVTITASTVAPNIVMTRTATITVNTVATTEIRLSVTNEEGPFGGGLTGLVIPANGTTTVTAFVEPWNATNKTVTWTKGTVNPNVIASFSPTTTQSGAATTITAANTSGSTSFYASQGAVTSPEIDFNIRTFPATQNVSTITLNISNIELAVGNTATLVTTVLPTTATDPRLRWTSSNPLIAEVNATTGVITARASGTAVITVNSVNSKSTSCTVNVYAPGPRIPLTGISIPATYSQPDNTTLSLPFTLTPANATSPGMMWTSSDITVATVTNEGRLTSLRPGTTTLSVLTTEGAKTATCVVTVTRVPVTGVTLNRSTRIELNTQGPRGGYYEPAGTYQLTATIQPSNATDKTVTWSSSDTSVVTVNSGLVTAVGAGSAAITVTTNSTDGAKTASCPVFVRLLRQVWINPTGADGFWMGSPNTEANRQSDEMQHRVNITQGFYMGQYTVTVANYNKVMGTTGGSSNRPIVDINWYEALVFCNRLSEFEGLTPAYRINGSTNTSAWGAVPTTASNAANAAWNAVQIVPGSTGYRLPTEAQWEYACRAGSTTVYNLGNAWSNDWGVIGIETPRNPTSVGTKTPNAWQLYDMHGNVMEYCWDWYGATYYEESPRYDPTGPASGTKRVLRGGSYAAQYYAVRSARRISADPYNQSKNNSDFGFRLVRP